MDPRCPRKLSKTPCAACPLGKAAVDAARRGEQGGCEWFVADRESHYCFWRFIENRGDGRPVPPAKIARLLMIDDGQVKKVVSNFRNEFKEILLPGSIVPSPNPDKIN